MRLALVLRLTLVVAFPLFAALHGVVYANTSRSFAPAVYAMKLVFVPFLLIGLSQVWRQLIAERIIWSLFAVFTPLFCISLVIPWILRDNINYVYYISDAAGLAIMILSIAIFYLSLKYKKITIAEIEGISGQFCWIMSVYMISYYFLSGGDKISITPEIQIPMALVVSAYLTPASGEGYRPSIWLIAVIALACVLSQLRENMLLFVIIGTACLLRGFIIPADRKAMALFVLVSVLVTTALPAPRSLIIDRLASMQLNTAPPAAAVPPPEPAPPAQVPGAAPGPVTTPSAAAPVAGTPPVAEAAPSTAPPAAAVPPPEPAPPAPSAGTPPEPNTAPSLPTPSADPARTAVAEAVPSSTGERNAGHTEQPGAPAAPVVEPPIEINRQAFEDGSLNQRLVEIDLMFREMSRSWTSLVFGEGFGATYANKGGVLIYYGPQVHNAHSTPFLLYFRNGFYAVLLFVIPAVFALLTIFARDNRLFRASLALGVMYIALLFNQYLYWGVQFGMGVALWFYCYTHRQQA